MGATQVRTPDFPGEVLLSDTPVAVDFFAEWCGPCKMLSPVLEKFAQTYDGKVKVVKVDVDREPELAGRFGIRGVPTVMFFKGGKVVDQVVGFLPPPELARRFESLAS
jgi:thioredoxin 1